MILLDTHGVSAVMRTQPAETVVTGLHGQGFASAVNVSSSWLPTRVLLAARVCGELMGDRKGVGLPMSAPDGRLGAIARLDQPAVATRPVLDLEHCGIDVLNPFAVAG